MSIPINFQNNLTQKDFILTAKAGFHIECVFWGLDPF